MCFTLGKLKADSLSDYSKVINLASNNGFNPSKEVVNAIINASHRYNINPLELTAIGILETGLGKYSATRTNRNMSQDVGLFQINEVNLSKCIEYNLASNQGSAMCAAKLLSEIKKKHKIDYIGRFHSNTPKHKNAYIKSIKRLLSLR